MQISDEGVLAGWAGVIEGQHQKGGSMSVRKTEHFTKMEQFIIATGMKTASAMS